MFTNPAQVIHGPALVGIIFNVLLYGVIINQTFTYFSHFRHKDRLGMQAFVAILFIADTLNTIFNIYFIYNALINNFGNVQILEAGDVFLASDAAMTAIIACMVQTFFAWRVKILTQNNWFTGVILFLAFATLGLGVGSAAVNHEVYPRFVDFTKYSWIVIPWLAFSAACDVVITAALTWKLKQRSGFSAQTDDILKKIMRLTIQNGLLTSVFAVIDIILFLTVPTGAHLVFNYSLAKLYSNSALSSLNSREGLTGTSTVHESSQSHSRTGPLSISRKPQRETIDFRSRQHTQCAATEVYIDVETHEMKDIKTAAASWESPRWTATSDTVKGSQAV